MPAPSASEILELGAMRARLVTKAGPAGLNGILDNLELFHLQVMRGLFAMGADEKSHVHRAASHALRIEVTRHALPEIRRAMEHAHPRVRLLAVTSLWGMLEATPTGRESEVLIRALVDPCAHVRLEGLRCILADDSRLESRQLIHAVVLRLTDRDPSVRACAAAALERIVDDESAPSSQRRIALEQQLRIEQVRNKLAPLFPLGPQGLPIGPVCLSRDGYSFSL